MNPEKGSIAICGAGRMGVILTDKPSYKDLWAGIHLEPGWEGKPWRSKNPRVVGHVKDLNALLNLEIHPTKGIKVHVVTKAKKPVAVFGNKIDAHKAFEGQKDIVVHGIYLQTEDWEGWS